jgi:hypothetical protein
LSLSYAENAFKHQFVEEIRPGSKGLPRSLLPRTFGKNFSKDVGKVQGG